LWGILGRKILKAEEVHDLESGGGLNVGDSISSSKFQAKEFMLKSKGAFHVFFKFNRFYMYAFVHHS
jgi:hypothetical protein